MASSYTKIFANPYPNGWENLPSLRTPIIAQALQQHTNAIINIENYLNLNDIPQKVSDLINDSIIIPTKTSQLTNDSGYITRNDIPTHLSQFENDEEYITKNDVEIPENLSDYNNDVGFVNNATNSLINYYLKSETLTKGEVLQLFELIKSFSIKVVNELPLNNISDTTIYCIPKSIDKTVVVVDSNLNLDNNEVSNTSPLLNLGNVVTSEQEVEDPFDG